MRLCKLGLAVQLCLIPTKALAYPIMTRYGYANCSSCHVSPTGGGILTPYGRMASEELLSTWAYENESEPLHGLAHRYLSPDDPIQVGGDVRYLYIHFTPDQQFWMQREGEFAATLTKGLSLVASGGYYPDGTGKYLPETRRNYVLFSPNEHLSFRAGKFFPAYGILLDDHTTATRSGLGWDQGEETYNFEASYKNQHGELFLTAMLGSDNYTELTPQQGYVFRTDEKGVALRAAAYIGQNSQAGISGLYSLVINPAAPSSRYYVGPFAIVGITQQVYVLAEVDAAKVSTSQLQYFSTDMLGWEVYKGIHIQGQYQRRGTEDEYDAKIQLFPRPHLEIVAEYESTCTANTALFLFHYYL